MKIITVNNIPSVAKEILIFAGSINTENAYQVYGGKSYIIPCTEQSRNIVYEDSVYMVNVTDNPVARGFYAQLTMENILYMHILSGKVTARLYWR